MLNLGPQRFRNRTSSYSLRSGEYGIYIYDGRLAVEDDQANIALHARTNVSETFEYGLTVNGNLSSPNMLHATVDTNKFLVNDGGIIKHRTGPELRSDIYASAYNHTHDSRYYTEGEIQNFFSGASSISGYNKSNWDTAHGWGNHASQGYATQSWVGSNYLSLSGGTLTGALEIGQDGVNQDNELKMWAENGYEAKLVTFETPTHGMGMRYNASDNILYIDRYPNTTTPNPLAKFYRDSDLVNFVSDSLQHKGNEVATQSWVSNNYSPDNHTHSQLHSHSNKSVLDGITSIDVSHWSTAYGWGDHAVQGYLKSSDLNGYATESWVGSNFLGVNEKAADSDKLDGYHASSFQRVVSTNNHDNLSAGWYTIAVNNGDRAIARFGVRDTNSGDHQTTIFYASHHYGAHSEITVLHSGRYSGTPIQKIRIREGGTYDGAMLQIYIDQSDNDVTAYLLGENIQSGGWIVKDWVPDGTDPGDIPDHTLLTNTDAEINLNNIIDGGIATTGNIYAGGDITQYKVWHTGNDGSGSGLNADLLDGHHASYFATAVHSHSDLHSHANKSVLDGISSSEVSNWNDAYAWGNHALQGYLTSFDLNGYATESWVNSNYAAAGHTHNYLPLSGGTLSGNLVIGSTSRNADTYVRALAADGYNTGFEAYGGSQGTGYLYVGQSSSYGGGIFYNGDGTPSFASNEVGNDKISFFRESSGTRTVVFYYAHNSSVVRFNDDIYMGGNLVATQSWANGQFEDAFSKNTAFNKNFGTTAGTVAEGNHTHSEYLTSVDLSGYATESYVQGEISALIDSSPSTLDTLNELAAALGDDPNFATTVSNQIGTKWTQDNTKISNWDTAYGWGDHSAQGYLTSADLNGYATETWVTNNFASDTHTHSQLHSHSNRTTLDSITSTKVSNWNTAFTWGDHSTQGYATTTWVSNNFALDSHTHSQLHSHTNKSTLDGISSTNVNNWNTAYNQRGSQIAGTGLSWDGSNLNVNVSTATPFYYDITNGYIKNQENLNAQIWLSDNTIDTDDPFTAFTPGSFFVSTGINDADGYGGVVQINNESASNVHFLFLGDGGQNPDHSMRLWKQTGGNVFYLDPDGHLMSQSLLLDTTNAVSSPSSGQLWYSSGSLKYYDGSSTQTLAVGGGSTHSHSNKSTLDGISSTNVNNWNAAYNWGDHSTQGYLTGQAIQDMATESWVQNNFSQGNHTHDYDKYNRWKVNLNGSFAGNMYSEYALNFAAGNNMTISFNSTTKTLTFDAASGGASGTVALNDGSASSPSLHFANDTNSGLFLVSGNNIGVATSGIHEFLFAQYGHFHADGNIYGKSTSTSSDIRLKTNIIDIENALDMVSSLRGVYFDWKDKKYKGRQLGLIAQEVEKIIPEVVSEDRHGYKSMDYSKLTSVLIEAVKELKQEIKELKDGTTD